ncbi:MAG: hypothetical protein A2902_05645 [Elusimicrobia bacterium RIFCSPLOWO2_01_FULL_64_13]|nr:MAG: hypothetical protein A2636_02660 [Elusimicrobia bacterium RIFCSPHIGHO2_01_FULL_64_10]OGR94241.1 MAG: hypothetical protein A2902_05645 [Elusimicrobia bacterium RIFCSPLOWO2_01_FULL_64_13]
MIPHPAPSGSFPTGKGRKTLGAFLVLFWLGLFAVPFLGAEDAGTLKPKRSWKEYFLGRSRGRSLPSRPGAKARADAFEELNPEGMVDLVDAQTTNIVDYGGYRANFRFYSAGGILSHLSFGVFQRLNIGASWDLEDLIGSKSPSTNPPTLNAKFRVYDGGMRLPSVAVGYDGQGRFFNDAKDEYDERERGLYVVFGRELLLPKLEFYGGANIADFKGSKFLGTVGASYTIEQKVALITEYDNIRVARDNRWNAAVRVFPIPSLGIDFGFRRIASNREKERIVRINYVGNF